MSDRTYIVGLSHEEIRDTRMALVLFAQTYRDMAKGPTVSEALRATLNREADSAIGVADRISAIVRQRATLDFIRSIPIRES